MKRKTIYICIFLLTVIICIAVLKGIEAGKRASTGGTVKALNAALSSEVRKVDNSLKDIFYPTDQKYRFLASQEYDKVINKLSKSYNLDASKDWHIGDPLVDIWGNRFEIGYQFLPNQTNEIIVISKGPDGILNSKDDISSIN